MENNVKVRPFLSVITLNVNGLNSSIKRHRVAVWIIRTQLYAIYKRPALYFFIFKDTHRLKVKEWKNGIPSKY